MSNKPTLVEALDSLIRDRMRGLHVGMPGRVAAYDEDTQRADVQPLIKRGYIDENGDRQAEALPIISDVPIIFMRANGISITFPITKGDGVWLMFSDFSIDNWLKHGGLRDPKDDRNHDLSDAVAIPGLNFQATDQVDSGSMVLAADEIRLGSKDASSADSGVVRKSDLAALRTAISGAAVVASDGGAAFKANILAAWPAATASTKVKAE